MTVKDTTARGKEDVSVGDLITLGFRALSRIRPDALDWLKTALADTSLREWCEMGDIQGGFYLSRMDGSEAFHTTTLAMGLMTELDEAGLPIRSEGED